MSQQIQAFSITAPGFYGLNTQDSSLDLASGFALIANNCVIDQYGRVGARKGWVKVNSAVNTDLSTNDIASIGEVVTADATSYTILAGNNKLFKSSGSTLVTLTYGGGGTAPTITASNWQMVSLAGALYLFQSGHDPLVFDPSLSTTAYRRISELTGYAGTAQLANTALSAYGRLWTADVSSDKLTVQWCDTKLANKWNTGTAGTLDTTTVWPRGGDVIVALGAHNGFLFIFGKNNILVYQGATTPSTMTLQDVITGIGCVARDSLAYTGTDLIFLSATGVRSALRTIQEKSMPLRDLSKNVRNDLISIVAGESLPTIKSAYNSKEAFYLLTLPVLKSVYCFDMKGTLQDGSARVTTWDSIEPKALLTKQDGTLYIGKEGYLATYSGYIDNTTAYRFQYFTNHTDLGTPSVTSILKKLKTVVIGGSNQYVTFKWGYDFTGNYYSQSVQIPAQQVSYYGIAEYNYGAEYSGGVALQTLSVYPTGSGKVIQTGYEADINAFPLSIQKIEIHAKNGKIV
tara:strand:- start:2193 stop:3740 length:1548 start_codon:yes stop_codon:yes gene_type:complete